MREVLISAQIAILELEGSIQAAATATANASQRGVFKRAKRVVQRVAYRKVFESPYLSRRVGRLLEKICRRVFKRIFKLTAPPYLDVEFFVDGILKLELVRKGLSRIIVESGLLFLAYGLRWES